MRRHEGGGADMNKIPRRAFLGPTNSTVWSKWRAERRMLDSPSLRAAGVGALRATLLFGIVALASCSSSSESRPVAQQSAPLGSLETLAATSLGITGAPCNHPIGDGFVGLYCDGSVEGSVSFPSTDAYTFEATAYGEAAFGTWPTMELLIDGSAIASTTVSSATASVFSLTARVTGGEHTIALAFTNDAYAPPQDRNLFVSQVVISATSTAPSPPSSCTSIAFVSGSLSVSDVAPGASVQVSCNYGPKALDTPTIHASLDGEACEWLSWNGDSAVFQCAAPSAAGTYPANCQLLNQAATNFCASTNGAGSLTVRTGGSTASGCSPADPDASSTTKNVLCYLTQLKDQSNHRLVTGQWGDWGYVDTGLMGRVESASGHLPGLVGADYATLSSGLFDTSSVNANMTHYWEQGALVQIDVLFPDPWTGGPTDTTVGNFEDVLTPDTAVYDTYMGYLDTVAAGLAQLQDSGVVVLLRPLMEMEWSGGRWYGGQSSFSKLWIQTFDYLTTTKGLHNLLWVWAVGEDGASHDSLAYYPGGSYVDVVGIDTYGYGYCDTGVTAPNSDYTACVEGAAPEYGELLTTGKPFALSEFGLQSWNWQDNTEPALDLEAAIQHIQEYMPEAVYLMAWSTGATEPTWELDTQVNAGAALNNTWVQNAPVPW
jgi:hypothetical protein